MRGRDRELAHVALLRGVNVAGKNRLPMEGLVQLFVEAGCREVEAYIQSGNVIYRANEALAGTIAGHISAQIAKQFGFKTTVVTRTAGELEGVVKNNPFAGVGGAEEQWHVLFLEDWPGAERVKELDGDRSPPDAFEVRGREVFLKLPNGMGRTKLTNAYFDAKLRTVSTARNWRTVTKLVELSQRG